MNADGQQQVKKTEEKISLSSLASLTGFPAKMIREELFDPKEIDQNDEISLEELRKAMMSFIDETMATDKSKLQ